MCGCGGPPLSPWLACLMGAACRRGGGGPFPGGVACHRCEWRLVSGAVPPPPPVLWGGQLGFRDPCIPGAVGAGLGTQHRPHSVRLCGPALRAVGVAGGRPRGGGAFRRCEGRLRSGAPPPPAARPLGGLSGSGTHVLWARVCGCWGPALSPWLACPLGAACRGAGGGPSPGGVACHRCEGRLVSGAVPLPAARPLGRAVRVPRPVCPGCGWCGRGDQHRPHIVRPCGPALRAVEVAGGHPRGGGAFRRCEGRLRSGAPPPPAARPLGGLSGSGTHVLWARVCGCGGPALSPWLARPVGAACRGGGGGPSPGGLACHRCEGRLVSGAVPPPGARPLGRAAGVRWPVCPGCSWRGRGDSAPAPQRAPLRPALRAVAVAEGCPRGGCLAPL